MKLTSLPESPDPSEEIAGLVLGLQETQQRLLELAGGELDAVLLPSGQSFLLQEAQEQLRHAEAAQRGFAALQSSILNALPAYIALLDHQGVILSTNDAWRNFAGGSGRNKVVADVGQNFVGLCREVVGPGREQALATAAGLQAVLDGEATEFTHDFSLTTSEGERWFRLRANPTGNPGNHGAVVMHLDITGSKVAEAALRESEERFRGTFEQAAVGIAHVSTEGRYLRVNDKFCSIVGYGRDELLGASFSSLTVAEDRPAGDDALRQMLDGRQATYAAEKRYRHKDGTVVWINLVATLERTLLGEPKYFIAVFEEITQRKRAAEQLEHSRALLNMASRVGRLGAWAFDVIEGTLNWSEEVSEIHEVAPGYVPTVEAAIEFYAPEFRATIREAVNACIQDGTAFDLELQIVTAKGRRVWTRAMGEAVRNEARAIVGVQGAFQDISDRKAGEEELARINRALKMLSACNESLIRAEDELELLEKICRITVQNGGYRMAWVGYAQNDDGRSLTHQAHAGAEDGYFSEIKVTWDEHDPTGQGPAGRAIRSGQPAICEDLDDVPHSMPWRASAQRRGYRGIICLPLRDAGHTFGILGLYSAEVKAISAEELQLLVEMADDLAFGVLTLRARVEQQRLQTAVLKVAAGVSAASGSEFFIQLASNMAEALGAHAGFVTLLLAGEPLLARTLAVVVDGEVTANFDYAIQGTPCEELLQSEMCVVGDRVAEKFPDAPRLAELGAQAYVGRRLDDSRGRPLGQLFVMFRQPLQEAGFISSTLQIFAARAAAELERQKTDARIREQASLIDEARDAIVVRSLEDRITFWSKGAERIYGWTSDEARGRLWDELLLVHPVAFKEAGRILGESGMWNGEIEATAKSGDPLTLDGRWTHVRNAQGSPSFILSIDTDITERRKIEQQFLRAQRMESIGTLAGGIAHDLNNSLSPIIVAMELLSARFDDPESRDLLEIVNSSALRGADMVRQVLAFARGEEGERQETQIRHLIRDVQKIVVDTFPKDIRVSTIVAPELWTVMADSTQLHQVVLNLCVNARDAMPDGGKLILSAENLTLDAHDAGLNKEAHPGAYVLFQAADTGTGMPPAVVEKIFDPFFTTKEIGKGTGLGLSSALAIVKSHGGFIRVESEAGRGTKFKVYLPAHPESASASQEERMVELPRGHGQLVLLVDDEEAVRQITTRTLEKFGYHAISAGDGAEAIALYAARAAEIAVVLTDMMMPVMDGLATIRVLRKLNPNVRIIGASGFAANEPLSQMGALGVRHFLPKPYTAEALLKVLWEILLEQP
jgi:PAS domain S-box-containing protein